MRNRGLTSLDALIIFVAIVLSVAVAAIVILTVGGALQQKITSKAVESRKDITAGVEVINVLGSDASPGDPAGTPHLIEDVYVMARILPGTVSVPLNTTLLALDSEGGTQTIEFNDSCETECTSSTTGTYMVFYLKEGNYHENDYINMGDVVKLTFKPDGGLREDREYRLFIIPQFGPKTIIKIDTPQTMTQKLQALWPVP